MYRATYDMKKLILLLFIPLVFGCGNDSKKEEENALTETEILENDFKRVCEIQCMIKASEDIDESYRLLWREMLDIDSKYREGGSVSEQTKKAWGRKEIKIDCPKCSYKNTGINKRLPPIEYYD